MLSFSGALSLALRDSPEHPGFETRARIMLLCTVERVPRQESVRASFGNDAQAIGQNIFYGTYRGVVARRN